MLTIIHLAEVLCGAAIAVNLFTIYRSYRNGNGTPRRSDAPMASGNHGSRDSLAPRGDMAYSAAE